MPDFEKGVGVVESSRSSAPTWTFGYTIFWASLSATLPLIMGLYPSRVAAIGNSLLCVVIIALGFGVYRRSRAAAWALVIFALIDVGYDVLQRHSVYLTPVLLLPFALTAAISLGKERAAP